MALPCLASPTLAQGLPPGVEQLVDSERRAVEARRRLEKLHQQAASKEDRDKFEIQADGEERVSVGDKTFWTLNNLRLQIGQLRLRSDSAVLVFDRDEYDALRKALVGQKGAPRRSLAPPYRQKGELARMRIRRLAEIGSGFSRPVPAIKEMLPEHKQHLILLIRSIYAKGSVSFETDGTQNLLCEKLWFSMVSDRAVMEDVKLRIPLDRPGDSGGGLSSFYLEAKKIVKQSHRLVAYDAKMSTCNAGDPHYALRSDRLSVVQGKDSVRFVGEGNHLDVEGIPSVGLPDYTFYSDQENWIPIQGFRFGSSRNLGFFALVKFGGRWNDLGQSVVDLFHDGPEKFRGEWYLETGYSDRRGVPLDAGLSYALPGSFAGDIDYFFLKDQGTDIRSPKTRLGGQPVTYEDRQFARTSNRFLLGESLRLDFQLMKSTDEAVYLEFRPNALKGEEPLETSLDLRYQESNYLVRLTGRTNLDDYQYDGTVRLTPKFKEELGYLRMDAYSAPLFELVDGVPLVLDAEVGQGYLENKFDASLPTSPREKSYRSDIGLELSTPMRLGPWALRPYFSGKDLWYSDTPGQESKNRVLLEAGITLSTRVWRDFDVSWTKLGIHGLRHEIIPEVRIGDRFQVSDAASEFYQFDETDALDEGSFVDVGLLNRVRTQKRTADGSEIFSDMVWIDLVQRLYPDKERDNGGNVLGLFEYEVILRPAGSMLLLPDLRLLFEGEYDWNLGGWRTRNMGMAFAPHAGATIAGEWRSGLDGDGNGSINYGARFWKRWGFGYGLVYDFEFSQVRSQSISMMREDHDWIFMVIFGQDEITGDRSVRFQFTPKFLGLGSGRNAYIGGDPAFGVRNTTNY